MTTRGETDTLQVVAVVTDENAINDFKLEIAGVDMTDSLTVVPTTDTNYPRARQYRVSFAHKLRPENYEIVMRAYQSPDTLAGQYHIAAEFRLRVESTIEVSVNGRAVASGAAVPTKGNYRVDLSFPVFVAGSEIDVFMDDTPVVRFYSQQSQPGGLAVVDHHVPEVARGRPAHAARDRRAVDRVQLSTGGEHRHRPDRRDQLPEPVPRCRDEFHVLQRSRDHRRLHRRLHGQRQTGPPPRHSRLGALPGENAVFWDGRDAAGDQLANGIYLYVIEVQQRGGSASTARGKVSKLQ